MSGDTTLQSLKRLTHLPDRDESDNGTIIAGQEYYDVEFVGGSISNVTLTDVTVNGTATSRTERIVTAAGDVTVASDDYIITMAKTTPAITTITLPAVPGTSRSIIVKDGNGDAASFNITIDGNGNTIDGSATFVMATNFQAVELVFNGTEWNPIAAYPAGAGGGGSGTVTNVSVVTANGFSGSVANSSTTPAITIDASGLDVAKLADGSVSNANFQYLNGVTSSIQNQIDSKQDELTGLTATVTELNYTDGVTSNIQTQLDAKAPTASPTFTGTVTLPAGQVVNGVTLVDGGSSTQYLSADGTYSTPAGGGGSSAFNDITTGTNTTATMTVGTGASLTTSGSGTISATSAPLSGVSGLGSGVATFLATPSSSNLAAAVTGETGSGALVFGTSPTLTTPNLGTPSAATLTNATGLPLSTGVTGTLAATNFPALTGDITTSAGSLTTAIASGVIVNADVNSSAAIALTKLAATTASRALVSDASGFITPSAITATELGYLDDVTGNIQTQLDGKQPDIQFQDEGSNIAIPGGFSTVNFTGSGVTASASLGVLTVDIPGGGGGGGGSVETVSIATANGLAGTSDGDPTNPEITLTTTVTGVLSGNGTSISSATTTGTGSVVLSNTPTLITPVFAGPATGDLTGNADTATALKTARTIGGVSFDGTANIVPQTIQIIDAAADTTTFPMLATAATGSLQPTTDAGLSYNASTNALTAGSFIGAVTGNASTATTLQTARTIGGVSFNGSANIVPNTITVADTTDTSCFVGLWESATGSLAPKTDAGITYNAGTGVLTATGFAGPLTGDVTGNVSGSSGSTTGNAATATALQTARTIGGVSFDGTANIVPATITVADTTDSTCFVGLWESFSGDLGPKTDGSITYNASTGALTAVSFVGNVVGSVTGTATSLATPRTINGTAFDGTANITVTAAAGTLTGTTLNSSVVTSSLTSVGTIGTGTWQGTVIGSSYGGAGTVNGIMKANGSGTVSAATAGTDYVSPATATVFTRQQNFNNGTLTDGASISWDLSQKQSTSVTLAGNRTLSNPTNMVANGTYILRVVQDGTGSRTLSFGTAYKWPGGTAPTLSTGAGAVDILTFVSDGTNMYGVAQLDFS